MHMHISTFVRIHSPESTMTCRSCIWSQDSALQLCVLEPQRNYVIVRCGLRKGYRITISMLCTALKLFKDSACVGCMPHKTDLAHTYTHKSTHYVL